MKQGELVKLVPAFDQLPMLEAPEGQPSEIHRLPAGWNTREVTVMGAYGCPAEGQGIAFTDDFVEVKVGIWKTG